MPIGRTIPRRFTAVAIATALAVAALLATGTLPLAAQPAPAPVTAVPLTGRHVFTDEVGAMVKLRVDGRTRKNVNVRDATNLAVFEITVQPGARFPWHTHDGPVLVAVTEGQLDYVYADDCVTREYPTGTAFVDPGANVHTAFNPSHDEETVVIATFLRAPAQGPVTIPVDAARAAAFDAACGFDPAVHAH